MADNLIFGYPVPAATFNAPHESVLEIKKSRFLAQGFRAETPQRAREGIEFRRELYPGASHNCWAFLAGAPGDTARVGSSDDGEPHGTAGRPMLNVLVHGNIGEIAIVVTRWFGGIKLGTGGLAHAYQESVKTNLQSMPLTSYTPSLRATCRIAYSNFEPVKRILPKYGAIIENEEYTDVVVMTLRFPEECAKSLSGELGRLCNGKVVFEFC